MASKFWVIYNDKGAETVLTVLEDGSLDVCPSDDYYGVKVPEKKAVEIATEILRRAKPRG